MRIAPFPARLSLAAILTLAISTTSTSAQQKTAAPPAPVPAQILSARKVFIANGAGETPIGSPFGDSDPTYDEFYAGVKSWNRYTLTAGPGDADLVLQVSCIWHSERGHSALVSYDEFLRLIVIDPKTGIRLWGLVEPVEIANLKPTALKNYENAMTKLLADVKYLTATPPAAKN